MKGYCKLKMNSVYKFALYCLSFFYFVIGSYNPNILGFNFSNFILFFVIAIIFLYSLDKIRILNVSAVLIFAFYLFNFCLLNLVNIINCISIYFKMIIPAISMFIFFILLRKKQDVEFLYRTLLYTNIITCIIGIFNFYVLEDYGYTMMVDGLVTPRMRGSFLQPNVFSMYIILTLPFMVWELHRTSNCYTSKKIQLLFYYGILLMNIFCLYMSKSRWSAICLVIASVFMIFMDNNMQINRKILLYLATVLLFVIILIGVTEYSHLFYRNSDSLRLESILMAFGFISESILWGNGIGSSFMAYNSLGYILDSTYLNIAIESGLIGISLFLVINIMAFVSLMRKFKYKKELYPVLYMSIMIIIGCCLENIFYNSLINSFFGLMWYNGFKVYTE